MFVAHMQIILRQLYPNCLARHIHVYHVQVLISYRTLTVHPGYSRDAMTPLRHDSSTLSVFTGPESYKSVLLI